MNILALDVAYNHMGWAQMCSDDLLAYGAIEPKKPNSGSAMLDYCIMDEHICNGLDRLMLPVMYVVAEMPACGAKSARAIAAMARASGIVSALCSATGTKLIAVTAQQAYKHTVGEKFGGEEKKQKTMEYICNLYPQIVDLPLCRKEHVCDAIAAYLAARKMGLLSKEE